MVISQKREVFANGSRTRTKKSLKEALSEQRLRLGGILLKAGVITAQQLEHALNHQKKANMKIGEILRNLRYSTNENVKWALGMQNRRLGEIFVEKGFFTENEINEVLTRKRHALVM